MATNEEVQIKLTVVDNASQPVGQAADSHEKFGIKARQAATIAGMFGASMKGAAGEAIRFSSHILSLSQNFTSITGLLTMVGVGIGVLIGALTREREELEKAKKAQEDYKKSLDELSTSIDDLFRSEMNRLNKAGPFAEKQYELQAKRFDLEKEISGFEEKIENARKERYVETQRAAEDTFIDYQEQFEKNRARRITEYEHEIFLRKTNILQLEADQNKILGMQKIVTDKEVEVTKKAEAEKQAAKRKTIAMGMGVGLTGFGEEAVNQLKLQQERQERDDANWNRELKKQQKIRELTIKYQEGLTNIHEANEDRREQISQRAIDREIQKRNNYFQAAQNSVALMGELGDMFAKDEKANAAIRTGVILAEAGIKSAMQFAEGMGKLPTNPAAAALHFTSAALFAAVGINKAVSAASGGGGGGGYGEATSKYIPRERPEDQKPMTIIINGSVVTDNAGKWIQDSLDKYKQQSEPGTAKQTLRI